MHEQQKTFLELFFEQKPIILGIMAATALFFWQVVIPIQKIQVQLAQIQIDIANNKTQYDAVVAENKNFSSRMTTVETKLDEHLKIK